MEWLVHWQEHRQTGAVGAVVLNLDLIPPTTPENQVAATVSLCKVPFPMFLAKLTSWKSGGGVASIHLNRNSISSSLVLNA